MKFKDLNIRQKKRLFEEYLVDFDLVIRDSNLTSDEQYPDKNIRAVFAIFCAISSDKEVVEIEEVIELAE